MIAVSVVSVSGIEEVCTVKMSLPSAGEVFAATAMVGDVWTDNYKHKTSPYKKLKTTFGEEREKHTGYWFGGARLPRSLFMVDAHSDTLPKWPDATHFVVGIDYSVAKSIFEESEKHVGVKGRADARKGR